MKTAKERRDEAATELLAIAAEHRGYSMPVEAQCRFDDLDRTIAACDAEIDGQAAAQEVEEAERLRAEPAQPALADRFKGYRVITTPDERAVARADIQSLAARCSGRSWTDEEQLAFDKLVYAVEVYDAGPPPPADPRDGILAEMRERAGNAPPQLVAVPPYMDSVRAQGRACRRSRIN